jgi:hypothetical protein
MLPPDIVAKLHECANTDFIAARDVWFSRQSWFSWAVIIGLLLEAPELGYEMRALVRKIKRFKYSILIRPNRVEIAKVLAFIGWIFIVGGLFGELRAASKIEDLSAHIQECNEAKVAEATEHAGDAATSARTAHDEADTVGKEADALSVKLQQELVLLDAVSPRSLLLQLSKSSISRTLAVFSGQKFAMETCGVQNPARDPEESDTWFLLWDILLNGAKWKMPENVLVRSWKNCTPVPGLLVFFNDHASTRTKQAAKSLCDEIVRVLPPQRFWPQPCASGSPQITSPIDEEYPWRLVEKDPELIVVLVSPRETTPKIKQSVNGPRVKR